MFGDASLIMLYELQYILYVHTSSSSSSSSSLARQPYVGLGLPQKLLPAKYPAIASADFVTRIISRVGLSAPRPTPGYPVGPMFSVRVISLS
jgi:hypothetical protein